MPEIRPGPLDCGIATGGTAAHLQLKNQQPGTYFVVVDGAQDSVGAFTLDAALSAPSLPPANDSCAAPAVLTVGAAPLQGTTAQATNDYSDSSSPAYAGVCDGIGSGNGADVVYQLTPAASGTLHVVVTPASNFDPAVAVLSGTCALTACQSTTDHGFSGEPESVNLQVTAGQTYYLVVDSYSASASSSQGSFTIAAHF